MLNVTAIGNLGRDPEMRYTPNGHPVTSFRMACRNGRSDEPTWVTVVAWQALAEIANQYLSKGSKVAIQGSLRFREYEGRDGTRKTALEIVARDIEFLIPRHDDHRVGEEEAAPGESESTGWVPDTTLDEAPAAANDLPF